MKKNNEYDISLDIGTASVGYSVIDTKRKIVKIKKRNFWGVRTFDEGETAEKRRLNRSGIRRGLRRRRRIALLREICAKEIMEVDGNFYLRLKESFLQEDERNLKGVSGIFNGTDYSDKTYYKEFPTIYHLRKFIVESKDKVDIRLIYLALHNIIKYRGNFLYENQDFSDLAGNVEETINMLKKVVSQEFNIEIKIETTKVIEILKDKQKTRKEKNDLLVSSCNLDKEEKQVVKNIFNLMLGLTGNLKQIFGDISSEKLKLSDKNAEENMEKVLEEVGEKGEVLNIIKSIYSWIQLEKILGDEKLLCNAKVRSYEKYKKQIRDLKEVIKNNKFEFYEGVFSEAGIFGEYNQKKIDREKFYSELTKVLDKLKKEELKEKDIELIEKIKKDIEEETFLIRLNNTDNGAIPYQLGLMEIEKIIESQGGYYPFLKAEAEKIKSLLTFRIPYYVGVLNKHSEFSWIKKLDGKENEKIYPWNFKEIVDIDKTAEGFIKKMTGECVYIYGEDVLPHNSLLYTDFRFYNELNKIKVNDKLLSLDEREKIRRELFLKERNVTKKKLETYFKKQNYGTTECKVTGFQGDDKINSTLDAYIDFIDIFGAVTVENRECIERIIYFMTVFNEKEIIERSIRREFPEVTDKAIEKILKKKYEKWGRLSKKLLQGIKGNRGKSIIEELETSRNNLNFMQIINDRELGFRERLEEINEEINYEKLDYENLVKPMQGSPKIKRGIWQSIKIVEEITKIMGRPPRRIYLEVARSDEESKRTLDKVSRLKKIYEELEDENDKKLFKNLSEKNYKITSEKLSLYYTQRGQCMYSGNLLDIDKLDDYEIDHIIPRSIVKDNSIENKVLVLRKENQRKASGKIKNEIINKRKAFWGNLYENGLIGSKKYNNLIDVRDDFSEKDEIRFIDRQLVETRQIIKHVANIYSNIYKESETNVITIKAGLISDFRGKFDLYKSREINDFHHAHDAFIVGFLGSYIMDRFNFKEEFIYDEYVKYKKKLDLSKDKNKYGFIIESLNKDFKSDEFIWDSEKEKEYLYKVMKYKDVYYTRKTEIQKGVFYKITPNKKDENKKKAIPLKAELSPEKYGYYEGDQQAYSAIVEYKKGKNRVKSLVGIPIRIDYLKSEEAIQTYLEKEMELKDVKIIKNRIPKYQKIKNDKGEFYLVSATEWINGKQLILSFESSKNYVRASKGDREVLGTDIDKIYDEILEKLEMQYPIFEKIKLDLEKSRDIFVGLENKLKIGFLKEILKITEVNSANGRLKVAETIEVEKNGKMKKEERVLINLGDRKGRLNSRNLDVSKTIFINESVTGVYIKEEKY